MPSSAPAVPSRPVVKNRVQRRIDQTNNSYVFPGLGLGAISVRARRISDGMLLAAARALAEASPSKRDSNANLLPPLTELRQPGIYNRAGYEREVRAALLVWADHLESIVHCAERKIVPLPIRGGHERR